jgi:hypothetical protein
MRVRTAVAAAPLPPVKNMMWTERVEFPCPAGRSTPSPTGTKSMRRS